jgi:hypothetical protein
MAHYNTYPSYLKQRFGTPVLKIPLNAGFSCPNRDGTIGENGCSFCDNRSFSPVAITAASLIDQFTNAIHKDRDKYSAFIAYLQPFTNTYAPVSRLSEIYEPLIHYPGVVGLAVGTRPDCLDAAVRDYLADVSKRTYLSVEIGLQSASDSVLSANHRGHGVSDFVDAVTKLSTLDIETVAHVMIGLPGDTTAGATKTAKFIASLPVAGVKIHQLMVIAGTQIHQWYLDGTVPLLTLEQYGEAVCEFLAHLRPDQHIHRIMANASAKNGLVAPLWSTEKMRSLNYLHAMMERKNVAQGSKYR